MGDIVIHLRLATRQAIAGRVRQAWTSLRGAWRRTIEPIADALQPDRVECGFCGWRGSAFRTFVGAGYLRRDALCPRCHSLERHRAFLPVFETVAACLQRMPIKLLDVAPNQAFSDYCRARSQEIDYISVDLESDLAMRRMDLEHLELPDSSFDVVVCFHVLDFLDDDRQGMSEIARVLRADGVALTQEVVDSTRSETADFGEHRPEHEWRARLYGKDFIDRWAAAGFQPLLVCSAGDQPPVMVSTMARNELYERIGRATRADSRLKGAEVDRAHGGPGTRRSLPRLGSR